MAVVAEEAEVAAMAVVEKVAVVQVVEAKVEVVKVMVAVVVAAVVVDALAGGSEATVAMVADLMVRAVGAVKAQAGAGLEMERVAAGRVVGETALVAVDLVGAAVETEAAV